MTKKLGMLGLVFGVAAMVVAMFLPLVKLLNELS